MFPADSYFYFYSVSVTVVELRTAHVDVTLLRLPFPLPFPAPLSPPCKRRAKGLWSIVMLLLRARSDKYEVQAYSGGPMIIFPEKFTEKNLVLFIGETLLSYG